MQCQKRASRYQIEMILQICMLLPFYRRVLSRPRHQWHLSGSLSLFSVPLSRCCFSFIHSSKAHWSLSEYVMCPWWGCSVIRVIQPKMLGFDYTAGTGGREGQKDNKMSPVWRRCWSWMIRSVITNQEMRAGWLANRHWPFFLSDTILLGLKFVFQKLVKFKL